MEQHTNNMIPNKLKHLNFSEKAPVVDGRESWFNDDDDDVNGL